MTYIETNPLKEQPNADRIQRGTDRKMDKRHNRVVT